MWGVRAAGRSQATESTKGQGKPADRLTGHVVGRSLSRNRLNPSLPSRPRGSGGVGGG